MNIKQEGLGNCKECGGPIMGAVNQPGIKGVCFACQAAGEPKTGRTVVVTGEDGDTELKAGPISGKVQLQEVEHGVAVGTIAPTPKKLTEKLPLAPPTSGTIVLVVTVDELYDKNIIRTLLQKIYDAIDNAPPAPTLKEQKKAIKLQDNLEALIKGMENK